MVVDTIVVAKTTRETKRLLGVLTNVLDPHRDHLSLSRLALVQSSDGTIYIYIYIDIDIDILDIEILFLLFCLVIMKNTVITDGHIYIYI